MTIQRRVDGLAKDANEQLRDRLAACKSYQDSIALDESIDATDTAQRLVYVRARRAVSINFEITQELQAYLH